MMKLDKFLEMINKALNSNTVYCSGGFGSGAPLIVQYSYHVRIEEVLTNY